MADSKDTGMSGDVIRETSTRWTRTQTTQPLQYTTMALVLLVLGWDSSCLQRSEWAPCWARPSLMGLLFYKCIHTSFCVKPLWFGSMSWKQENRAKSYKIHYGPNLSSFRCGTLSFLPKQTNIHPNGTSHPMVMWKTQPTVLLGMVLASSLRDKGHWVCWLPTIKKQYL